MGHGCGYQENSEGKVISTCGVCGKGDPTFYDWNWSSWPWGMSTPAVTQTPPKSNKSGSFPYGYPGVVYAVMFYPASDLMGTLMALFYNEELAQEYAGRQLNAERFDVHEVEVNG